MSKAILCIIACALLLGAATAPDSIRLPGFTAYSAPDADAVQITKDGISGWDNASQQLVWYVRFMHAGAVNAGVPIALPAREHARYRLTIAQHAREAEIDGGVTPSQALFGSFEIPAPGYYRITLEGLAKSGATFGSPQSVNIDGPAANDAFFSMSPERGAPSVHLHFVYPKDARVVAYYDEVTVKQDPVATYYEAAGFGRGYFGIQVNSPTERRIIFSVWNAGNEPTDPSKVPVADRVRLLAKGPGVFTGSFGNEGTGGHSHLVYPWKTGDTYRFLVTARPNGTATIYSGYFYFPEKRSWGLISSWSAPKDGGYLTGFYAFIEDFWGSNGDRSRLAEFGNQWMMTADGMWHELNRASFTHTASDSDRVDRGAGVVEGNFFLQTGGFVAVPPIVAHAIITRPYDGREPVDATSIVQRDTRVKS